MIDCCDVLLTVGAALELPYVLQLRIAKSGASGMISICLAGKQDYA